jgi:hypothetical protein
VTDLRVSSDFTLPLDLVVQQTGILARTGAGKTNTAVVIVEEVLGAGQQVVILDPPGAWWGLRSSGDGSAPGYPIVVLGGSQGDLPLEPSAGQTIADFVVDEGASVILDLSEFSGREMGTFVTAFAERLYTRKSAKRDPMLLVIEEADEVAPQRPMPEQNRMLGAIERIVKRGRMRGIGTLVITQRSASLNKNVLSQIGTMIAMQTTAPQDIKAIDGWIERTGDQERRQQLLSEIAELPIGTAFLWSPAWLREFRKVHFRRRRTFDSSATPKPGQQRLAPKQVADVDLEGLRQRMADTIEKAKAEDPKELRRRIVELEKQLKARPTETVVERIPERVEVPVVTENDRAQLTVLLARLVDVSNEVKLALEPLVEQLARVTPNVEWRADGKLHILPESSIERESSATITHLPARKPPPQNESGLQIKAGARRMLEALAHYPDGLTRQQVATLAGMRVTSGTFTSYLSTLRRADLIAEPNGHIAISEAGLQELGRSERGEPLPPDEVQAMWRSTLKAGARAMFDELLAVYPEAVTRQDLADRVEMSATSGTFTSYLSTLRRNGLLEDLPGGYVRASDNLFLSKEG